MTGKQTSFKGNWFAICRYWATHTINIGETPHSNMKYTVMKFGSTLQPEAGYTHILFECILTITALLLTVGSIVLRGAGYLAEKGVRLITTLCLVMIFSLFFVVVYILVIGVHTASTGINSSLQ